MADAAAIFRREAEARFSWVRRDRGSALYIARGPLSAPALLLDAREEDGVYRLTPSEEGSRRLSALLPPCPDRSMEQFCGGSIAGEDLLLLSRGLKLLEAPAPGEAERYMAAVHSRAAVLLRTKRQPDGGALWVCAQIAHIL